MSIYSSTRLLWKVSRVFGLHASEIPEDGTLQINKDKCSFNFTVIFWANYSVLFLLSGVYFEYRFEYTGASINVSKIVQFTDQLITAFNTSTFCVSIAYSFIHRQTLRKILQEFTKVEEVISKNLHIPVSHRSTGCLVNCGLGVIIIAAVLSVTVLFTVPTSNRLNFVKGWILYYIFIDVADVYALQFIILVFVLRQELIILEQEISALQNENVDKLHIAGKMKIHQQEDVIKTNEVKTILCIKMCSRNIYEISLKVNDMFSVPLFFSVANSVISLFSGIYFSFFGFIYGDEIFTPITIVDFLPSVMLLLRHFLKLLCVAVLCENTYTIRKNIGWLLHNIQTDGKKQSFKQNVTEYSMQLIHEKIIFSASGFFDLNSKVLQMVISSVAIYLVILIQFDVATNQT